MLAVWSILFAIVSAPTVTAYFCSNLQVIIILFLNFIALVRLYVMCDE